MKRWVIYDYAQKSAVIPSMYDGRKTWYVAAESGYRNSGEAHKDLSYCTANGWPAEMVAVVQL